MNNNSLTLLLILILIAFGVYYFCRHNSSSSYKSYFEALPGDHRPALGDFLPTVGNVPSEGGYEDLSAVGTEPASHLDDRLCEECVSHCVAEKVRMGQATNFPDDRAICFQFCKIECNPEFGL